MADVFLSYSRGDKDRAQNVSDSLVAEGLTVWWDAALQAGETYDEVTEKNLREAGAVVVLWSKKSVTSKWVRAEATVGERASTLVPALLEECDRPVRFELVQTADLMRWHGDRGDPKWRAFVSDIKGAIARRAGAARTAQAAAASASGDSSIETTFWNSIKDTKEASDFEAYLARYPQGHFSDLARNRLAAVARASGGAPASAKPAPAPARAKAVPPPPPPKPAPKAEPAPRSSGTANPLVYLGIALGLGAVGVAAFMLTRAAPDETAASAPIEVAAAATAAPSAPEPPAAQQTIESASEDIVPVSEESLPDLEATSEPVQTAALEAPVVEAAAPAPKPAATTAGPYRDCDACPLMTPVSGGTFMMGSPTDEAGRNPYEGPQHEVSLRSFAIGVYEVTSEEWTACVADGACEEVRTAADGKYPALGVSWRGAKAYTSWLSKKTGARYRLPSESEWEFAARAGSDAPYSWGPRFDRARVPQGEVKPVGSFDANAFGVHDMLGNAREWVEDCYVNNYKTAPTDGGPATDGDCSLRVIRGGYWSSPPADMRSANRSRIAVTGAPGYMGFRVASDVKG